MRAPRSIVWISSVALAAGCVTVPRFQVLQRRVEELQARGGGVPAGHLAELQQEIDALREQTAQMRREIDETRHLTQLALDELAAVRRMPRGASSEPGSGRTGEIALIPRMSVPPGDGPPRADQEFLQYEATFCLDAARDYGRAVAEFRAFVQAYPGSDYADNALFWLAECHQKRGGPMLAAISFERVHKGFPNGNKVPDALYRQAVALLEIGEQKGERPAYESAARELLHRILAEHPRSERVAEVRRMLQRLGA